MKSEHSHFSGLELLPQTTDLHVIKEQAGRPFWLEQNERMAHERRSGWRDMKPCRYSEGNAKCWVCFVSGTFGLVCIFHILLWKISSICKGVERITS